LTIEPAPPKSLMEVLATLPPLDEDFPPIPDPLPGGIEIEVERPKHTPCDTRRICDVAS
jgi:hypothetical protein